MTPDKDILSPKEALPTEGGSYVRGKDGRLRLASRTHSRHAQQGRAEAAADATKKETHRKDGQGAATADAADTPTPDKQAPAKQTSDKQAGGQKTSDKQKSGSRKGSS